MRAGLGVVMEPAEIGPNSADGASALAKLLSSGGASFFDTWLRIPLHERARDRVPGFAHRCVGTANIVLLNRYPFIQVRQRSPSPPRRFVPESLNVIAKSCVDLAIAVFDQITNLK